MAGYEQFDENNLDMLLTPAVFAATSRQEMRQSIKIDTDFSLSLLEYEFVCRQLDKQPRFFVATGSSDGVVTRRQTLVQPTRGSHNSVSYFVAHNLIEPHPSLVDGERLMTTAYKFIPSTRQILQSPEFVTDREGHNQPWIAEDGFGPFLWYFEGVLELSYWDQTRLTEPPTLPPRLSAEYVERGKQAERLLHILRGLHVLDEVQNFTLLETENTVADE